MKLKSSTFPWGGIKGFCSLRILPQKDAGNFRRNDKAHNFSDKANNFSDKAHKSSFNAFQKRCGGRVGKIYGEFVKHTWKRRNTLPPCFNFRDSDSLGSKLAGNE